ncbi:MAG TPA: glycogen-binding domain-containing protein [Verrucomicrobiae bacterium]|nr:glycogen-binding domain-containing protein [Verrucomicrobiae bacterium]
MSNAVKDPRKPAGRFGSAAAREVAFILNNPGAESVYLCGDFNEWFPVGLPMISRADGRLWEKRLLLPPGRYEYKFVVDGVWMHNPDAGENVRNAFGSLNSVVEVRR